MSLRESIKSLKVTVFGCNETGGNPCVLSTNLSEGSVTDVEILCNEFADEQSIGFLTWIFTNKNKLTNFEYNTPEEGFKKLLDIYKSQK